MEVPDREKTISKNIEKIRMKRLLKVDIKIP